MTIAIVLGNIASSVGIDIVTLLKNTRLKLILSKRQGIGDNIAVPMLEIPLTEAVALSMPIANVKFQDTAGVTATTDA